MNIAILDVSLSKPVCQCLLQLWYFYQCCCWNLGNLDNKTVCVLYTYRHNKRLTRIRRNLIRKKKLMSWALCLSLYKQFPKVELTKNIITFFSAHMHCSWSLYMCKKFNILRFWFYVDLYSMSSLFSLLKGSFYFYYLIKNFEPLCNDLNFSFSIRCRSQICVVCILQTRTMFKRSQV